MGKEDLGYPSTMFPLGYSYGIGQEVLHEQNIPADPTYPYLPRADYIDRFWQAARYPHAALDSQKILGHGPTMDQTGWTSEQFAAFHADALAHLPQIRTLYAGYLMNGPLPPDDPSTTPTAGMWESADNITDERHVYVYAAIDGSDPDGTAGWAKYLQIQGFTGNVGTPSGSTEPGAWVLPRRQGLQIYRWRYNADHAGAPYDNSQWKSTFDWNRWQTVNSAAIADFWVAVIGTLLTVISLGTLGPAIAAAAVALGVALSAAAEAAAVAAVTALAIGAVKYGLTGDSSQIMAALGQLGTFAVGEGPDALDALGQKFPAQAAFIKDIGTHVSDVVNGAQAAIGAGASELSAYIDQAKALATNFPQIDGDYWNAAKTIVGGSGTPGNYFLNLAAAAPSLQDLKNLETQVPEYARGFLHYGATIRAVEITQYKRLTGGGVIAMPQGLVPLTAIQRASQVMAMPTAIAATLKPPIGKRLSPDQIVAAAKAAKAQQTVILLGAAGLGVAYWLGLLKFLF